MQLSSELLGTNNLGRWFYAMRMVMHDGCHQSSVVLEVHGLHCER